MNKKVLILICVTILISLIALFVVFTNNSSNNEKNNINITTIDEAIENASNHNQNKIDDTIFIGYPIWWKTGIYVRQAEKVA